MAISPINFVSGFGLVPIFAWLPIDDAKDTNAATATPHPAAGEAGSLDGQACAAGDENIQSTAEDPSAPKMRLVFVGFQWRESVEIANFPRPDWMAGLAGVAEDPSDPSTKRDDHRHEGDATRALKASIAARQSTGAPAEPTGPSPTGSNEPE